MSTLHGHTPQPLSAKIAKQCAMYNKVSSLPSCQYIYPCDDMSTTREQWRHWAFYGRRKRKVSPVFRTSTNSAAHSADAGSIVFPAITWLIFASLNCHTIGPTGLGRIRPVLSRHWPDRYDVLQRLYTLCIRSTCCQTLSSLLNRP